MADARSPVDAAALRAADAVGALMESWGFKRNMGRLWGILYLENRPLSAAEIGERLSLSAGAVSMLINEMQDWGAIKKALVLGERREYFEAETSIWKMVSRVFRERELQWIHAAAESFEAAQQALAAAPTDPADDAERRALIESRVTGLSQLAQVGDHFLRTVLDQGSVDVLPIKTLGDLAKAVRGNDE
jgi:DNA-binding transcriptional regulator GbsR (MarR family)